MITRKSDTSYSHDFYALMIYSLLPGFSKILGIQYLMIGSVPIILYLILHNKRRVHLYKFDLGFIFFVLYILILSLIYIVSPYANRTGIYMAIFLDVIPMVGYVYSRNIPFEKLSRFIVIIASIHCIIAVVLYLPFQIVNPKHPYVEALTEGVAFGRMSSVSGSLGFGNMILTAFILSIFHYRKFLPIIIFCWIFSGQRSAWLGGILGSIVILILGAKNGNGLLSIKILSCVIIGFMSILFVITNILDINLDFIASRISDISNASSERSGQWINGLQNFRDIPIGAGPGQVGQIASRYEESTMNLKIVPDGDYLRQLSEYGVAAILFWCTVFLLLFLIPLKAKLNFSQRIIVGIVFGNLFQMIGSNITEFFYTNFIYWMIIGYFFSMVNSKVMIIPTKRECKAIS